MKKLYEFTVDKEVEVVEKTTSKNENGDNVTVEKKVKKTVPQKFFIRKPTRALFDDSDLFYGVKLSEGIKAGLLTRTLLNKRYVDDGGALAEKTKEAENQAYQDLYFASLDLKKLEEIPETERASDYGVKVAEIKDKMDTIKKSLTSLEMQKESLYDSTAETRARNKTITWWILQLSYKLEDDKEIPFFGEGPYEKKMDNYDEIFDAGDEFNIKVANRFIYYVSYWSIGRAAKQEDFDEVTKELNEAEKAA